MKLRKLLTFGFLLITANVFGQFGSDLNLVKIDVYKSFDKIHSGSEMKIAVKTTVEDTWHINSNKPNDEFLIPTELEIKSDNNFELKTVSYPKHKEMDFGFSDKPVAVYEHEFFIGAVISVPADLAPGSYSLNVVLQYQACNDASCMPPSSVDTLLVIEIVDNKTPVNEINSEIFSNINISYSPAMVVEEDDSSIASTLESSGLILSLLFVFIGGLALNLTPCVYPLIPITIGYFGGQSEGKTGKLFVLGILYVLGMAITYSIVGVVTSLSGAVFGSLLQNPIVIIFVALILIALSLSMFGLYEFKMPDKWVMKAGGAKSGVFGALLMGLTMGIVAAPCIGPFVLGLVTYVGAKGDPLYGFLMFFFLALGLGTPYLFLALFSGKIKSLPKAGFWMEAVKHIFGFILIAMAIYFVGPLLPKDVEFYLLPIFLILSALYLLFFDKTANNIKGFLIFKTLFSILIIAVAAYMLWPVDRKSPEWIYYDETMYEDAMQNGDKIFLDFYADWCIPCKELDALTFSDERVIKELSTFKTFKVDMTQSLSEETEKLRDKFEIVGMPTLIVINSYGEEVKRITGFMNADEFLKTIENVN